MGCLLKGREGKEGMEKGMRVIEFAKKNGIRWFPIKLEITEEGKKELKPLEGEWRCPSMTDFEKLREEELKERQEMVDKYDYIALDTKEVYQIDFDTRERVQEMEKLKGVCPYFESTTKGLPHCFIKSETTAMRNRYATKWEKVELLCGQWSYCPKEAEIYNAEKQIPEFSLDSIVHGVYYEKRTSTIKPTNGIDSSVLKTVVMALKAQRSEDYHDWLRVIFAILKTGEDNGYFTEAEDLAHMWSKRSKKYDGKNLNDIIQRYYCPERSPTFGTLCYMLKEDDAEKFEELLKTSKMEMNHNDLTACEAFEEYNKENGYEYIRTDTDIYWYHKGSGIWQKGLQGIRSLLVKCYSLGKYRVSAKLQTSMLMIFKDRIKKEEGFFLRAYNSTKRKIAFNNGIYDFKERKLIPFDSRYVFFYKMKWDYTEEIDEVLVKEIKRKIFYEVFDEKRGDYYMDVMSRALAGEVEDKAFNVIIGDGNSGKGVNSTMSENAFGNYCMTFNAESLQIATAAGDQAKNRSWMVSLQFARVAIANEVTMATALDGNKIKTFSGGGDTIMARVNHKDETNFKMQCTPFYYVNDMPKIKPMLQELKNRMKYIETQYSYLSGPLYEQQKSCSNVRIADPTIKSVFCTNEEVLKTYAIMICQNYKDEAPEPPEEVLKSIEEWTDADDVKGKMAELFEATENEEDTLTARDVMMAVSGIGLLISDTKIGREMAKLGYKKKDVKRNNKTVRVYTHIKLRYDTDVL